MTRGGTRVRRSPAAAAAAARTTTLRLAAGLLVLLGLAACGGEGPAAPTPAAVTLAPRFRLEGTASGAGAEGLSATCSFDLLFEVSETVGRTGDPLLYGGTHGGEVVRRILAADGSGLQFVADVFGEVEARAFAAGRVEIDLPGNRGAEGRFWRNLASFQGTLGVDGRGRGAWTCAPLDIDSGGYVDTSVVVGGTWSLTPLT